LNPLGYHAEWHWGEKKGYSGVATFSKTPPRRSERGFALSEFDNEGRVLATRHGDVTLFNIYFPKRQARRHPPQVQDWISMGRSWTTSSPATDSGATTRS